MKFIVTLLAVSFACLHQSHARILPGTNQMLPQYDDTFTDEPFNEKYAVMFDAGSSGTRVKVYKYEKTGDYLQVSDIQEVSVPKPNKIKPGLSTFADNPKGIREYLRQLLEGAQKVVPKQQQATTPLRIFGTAGMRLLKEEEARVILDEVDNLLTDKKFNKFLYKKTYTKIITGEEEALYDWVTINFLKGAFSSKISQKTYGALDMGGASHQNAFEIGKHAHPTRELNIMGKTYDIYAHSYLGGGENEALDHYLHELVKMSRRAGRKIIISPCHYEGFLKTVDVDGKKYEIRGKFLWPGLCLRSLKKVFFCDKCRYSKQPKLVGDFYGISVFYYALTATEVVSHNDQQATLPMIYSGIQRSCSISKANLDFQKDSYADKRCFQMSYIAALLKFGYKVKPRSFRLFIAESLHGFEPTWTVGAMLLSNGLI